RLVAGKATDILALSLRQKREYGINDLLVEAADQIGSLVVRHQVEEFGRVLGGHGRDQVGLAIVVQIGKDLGAIPGWEYGEKGIGFRSFQVFHQLGDAAGVILGEVVGETGNLAFVDQLAEVWHQERISHEPFSASPRPVPENWLNSTICRCMRAPEMLRQDAYSVFASTRETRFRQSGPERDADPMQGRGGGPPTFS